MCAKGAVCLLWGAFAFGLVGVACTGLLLPCHIEIVRMIRASCLLDGFHFSHIVLRLVWVCFASVKTVKVAPSTRGRTGLV